jgi:hypothetical protein
VARVSVIEKPNTLVAGIISLLRNWGLVSLIGKPSDDSRVRKKLQPADKLSVVERSSASRYFCGPVLLLVHPHSLLSSQPEGS